MQSSPALQAAKHFLSTVWDSDRPSDEALLAALDGLVAAYHVTPDGGVSDPDVEAPRQEGTSLFAEAAARFPDFGLYPVADPSKSMDDALMMADARRLVRPYSGYARSRLDC